MKTLSQTWQSLSLLARFGVVAGGLVLLLGAMLPREPALPPTASQRALRPQGVTMAGYGSLHLNTAPATSYAMAVARLGEGSLLDTSADGRTRTYQWNGGGRWARLEASFRDGYLVGKSEFALQSY